MEIDPRFKAARKNASRRKMKSWLIPSIIWGSLAVAVIGGGLGLYLSGILTIGSQQPSDKPASEGDGQDEAASHSYTSALIDLAGDPMVLRFDTSGMAQHSKAVLRPPSISPLRAGDEVVVLQDDMITSQEQLITTIPSSREDFAFFQAQKSTAGKPLLPPPPTLQPADATAQQTDPNVPADQVQMEGDDGSWGANLDGSTSPETSTFTKTAIENTTSLNFILPEGQRKAPYKDIILRLKGETDLAALMAQNGFDEAASKRFVDSGTAIIPEIAKLAPGYILAMRGANRGAVMVPVQLSLYTGDTYFGSIALSDSNQVVNSADPWVEQDLFSYAGETASSDVDITRKYRMLDAFYSAAIRNGVPSAIVAETIVLMSQSYDLDSFAAPGDKMTLVYSKTPGAEGPGAGQILYAAIKGEGKVLECNVYKPTGKDDYACFGQGAGGGGGGNSGGISLRPGMVTPTKGVLTSRFGPRMHPILKVIKVHNGTDWAAPIGTPVVAAFDGTILAAGNGGTYGNVVKISHPGNLESRYAHLSAFAPGLRAGQPVKAGDLIGYVGTTGQSTGPHLHFELYENGAAVDPLGGSSTVVADGGGSAVEVLVDQIIHVESGGNANAKNPLSSATGLGQFIESTWIRMMNQYRPDLATSLSRDALLALRNDPTISKEMITALAREGESYLRARGHEITAGRLYLCHFLGAEGANMVLNASDAQLVVDVMGQSVINANPFLTGKTIAYVKDWAENKMNHKGGGSSQPAIVIPPEVMAYAGIIKSLVDGAG